MEPALLLWAACSAAWLSSLRSFYLDLAWNCCFNLHLLSLILTPYTNAESLAPFSWWFPLKFWGLLLCPPQSCPSSRLNQPWTLSLKGGKSAPNLNILVASPILSPVYQCFSCTEKPKIGGSMLTLSYRCWIEGVTPHSVDWPCSYSLWCSRSPLGPGTMKPGTMTAMKQKYLQLV